MVEDDGRGPPVPNHEDVYRAILYPIWWVEGEDRPSSAAFDYPKFSVEIVSRTTPRETAARFRSVSRLVQFGCGAARNLGFDTRDERDDAFPDNAAHAHVYFDGYNTVGRKMRKRTIRRLIDHCSVVDVA